MRKNKLFTYYRTLEEIKAYAKVPVYQKLRWLEEANNFLYRAMPRKAKEIRERFRKGVL